MAHLLPLSPQFVAVVTSPSPSSVSSSSASSAFSSVSASWSRRRGLARKRSLTVGSSPSAMSHRLPSTARSPPSLNDEPISGREDSNSSVAFWGAAAEGPRESGSDTTTSVDLTASMRAAAVSDPGPPRLPLRKAESDREILVFVPLTIAYLEQVKLEISVTKQHADVRYVLSVHHAKMNRTWHHLRSFDEYRKLQQRLLKVLAHGHFCSADCPWMFTFLKSYFPKKHLFFHFSSRRVIAARKVALEKLLLAVQQFLLNRANHNCTIMTTAFANEVVEFIYGDQILTQYPLEHLTNVQLSPSGVSSSSAGSAAFAAMGICSRRRQGITDSLVSSTSDECDIGAVAVEDDDDICQICDSSLYGEAFVGKHERTNSFVTNSESSGGESSSSFMDVMGLSASTFAVTSALAALSIRPASPTSASTLSSSGTTSSYRRRNTYYVTTLGCGHQFHDECIVPKLNETLRCPTCNHLEVTT